MQEDGLLSATVVFQSAPTPDQVDALEAVARVRRVLAIEPIAMVLVAPSQLDAVRTVPGVASVDVNLAPQSAHILTWTTWGSFVVLGLCLCWSWVVWVLVLGN